MEVDFPTITINILPVWEMCASYRVGRALHILLSPQHLIPLTFQKCAHWQCPGSQLWSCTPAPSPWTITGTMPWPVHPSTQASPCTGFAAHPWTLYFTPDLHQVHFSNNPPLLQEELLSWASLSLAKQMRIHFLAILNQPPASSPLLKYIRPKM